jgi:hypothetical protein
LTWAERPFMTWAGCIYVGLPHCGFVSGAWHTSFVFLALIGSARRRH